MSEMPIWLDYVFFGFALTTFFVWNKLNKKYLTAEELKLKSRLLSEAMQRELKIIWIIIAAILAIYGFLFVLERVFQFEKVTDFFYIVVWLSVIYGVFRNQVIYRRANFPSKFIRSDFALCVFICLAFAAILLSNLFY